MWPYAPLRLSEGLELSQAVRATVAWGAAGLQRLRAGLGVLPHWRRRLWLVASLLAVVLTGAWVALRWVPLPAALFAPPAAGLEFLDRHGESLRERVGETSQFQERVDFARLPAALVQATLAAEDSRFWQHPGVDWRGTLRAAVSLVRNRRVVSGGSTITQQLVKLAHPRPRTFKSKLIEAIQALRLEQVWDKRRILTEYLSRLDYGNLAMGSPEAARFYFAKPLRELSLAESAFLAGLPQSPGRLNPYRRPERARRRQQWVLQRLRETGQVSEAAYRRAATEALRLAPPRRPFQAPHFVDLLLREAEEGGARLGEGRVVTTLDLELNRVAESVLRRQLARLRVGQARDGAVVVLENRTGAVLALVGSGDYFAPDDGQVNGAWAIRSAGSALKPFTYLLAFEQGAHAATLVADVPAEFATPTGVFRPVNYNRHCYGPLRYRVALANSLNIPAVKVLASVGGPAVLRERLRAAGLSTLTRPADFYGLGLTIGNAGVRLLELVNAYAALARLGEFRPYRLTPEAAARSGPTPARRVAEPAAAWLIADILSDNQARALAFGTDSPLRFDFPVACKTGTSSSYRDNWAFGYTPEFTVGVWVGNFDGSPMHGVSGVTGAAPVLHEVFEFLHRRFGTSWYAPPASVVSLPVHPLSGKRLPGPRPGALTEWFVPPALPAPESPEDCDAQGRVRLPAEFADWLASGANWLRGQVVLDPAPARAALRVVSPLPGAVCCLDPDLPDAGRWLHLRAEGSGWVDWESDTLDCQRRASGVFARLVSGRHRLIARDAVTGERRETWVLVRSL